MTKGKVQRARLAQVKAGKHPSIDAIRVELGNTGSKATIFRHLKEIEAEEGGAGVPQGALSEELMAFASVNEARQSLAIYMNLYNVKRPHSTHSALTPEMAYFESLPALTLSAKLNPSDCTCLSRLSVQTNWTTSF